MKFVPNDISKLIGRKVLLIQKNSPTVLFGAGVVGVITTAVLASRATLKLDKVINETQQNLMALETMKETRTEYTSSDFHKDAIYIYTKSVAEIGKLYAPTIVVGTMSIGALAGAHRILNQRNLALSAAYAAVDRSFAQYRERVIADLGEAKDDEYRFGVEDHTITRKTPTGEIVVSEKHVNPNYYSPYARFFDEVSQNWSRTSEYNFIFLRAQQNYANDLLASRGHVFLNEIYDMLGIERSRAGAVVGWVLSNDGDNYIDFGIFNGDSPRARDFVNGREGSILLDFNVQGVIYNLI